MERLQILYVGCHLTRIDLVANGTRVRFMAPHSSPEDSWIPEFYQCSIEGQFTILELYHDEF